nr:hypothetical protein [Apium graveolens]QVJ98052.1 hypothetical protein [Apium graveolens]QVJ98072.1 hypothetical protein [Apium graveolens]
MTRLFQELEKGELLSLVQSLQFVIAVLLVVIIVLLFWVVYICYILLRNNIVAREILDKRSFEYILKQIEQGNRLPSVDVGTNYIKISPSEVPPLKKTKTEAPEKEP